MTTRYSPPSRVYNPYGPVDRDQRIRDIANEEIRRTLQGGDLIGTLVNRSIPKTKIRATPVVETLPSKPETGDEVYYVTPNAGVEVLYRYNGEEWLPVRGAVHLLGVGTAGAIVDGAWHDMVWATYNPTPPPSLGYFGFHPEIIRDGGFLKTRTTITIYFTGVTIPGVTSFNMSFGFNVVFGGTAQWAGVGTQLASVGIIHTDTGWIDIPDVWLGAQAYFLQPMYLYNIGGSGSYTVGYQFISVEVR